MQPKQRGSNFLNSANVLESFKLFACFQYISTPQVQNPNIVAKLTSALKFCLGILLLKKP
jgi:hypothetical protein